jgi:hypothetical protein
MGRIRLRGLTFEKTAAGGDSAGGVNIFAKSTRKDEFVRKSGHFGREKVCLNRHPIT